ncbi:esterase/lipase family protein [Streptomyces sp. NPDC057580]|uniref:esterase/lipase family protein n=1 Tax=Streptomyces sp. NPDC057580 TaxID=3346173 RepID=UPI0036C33854
MGLLASCVALMLVACSQGTNDSTKHSKVENKAAQGSEGFSDVGIQRADTKSRPVFFIHGYDFKGSPTNTGSGHDCKAYWNKTLEWFKHRKWSSSNLITWGYYGGNKRCDRNLTSGHVNTEPTVIARKLANHIYENYSKKDRPVDMVGHSYGGLIIRAAIVGTNKKVKGFPPYLLIEDAVTMGTPHHGATLASACPHVQCKRMAKGSNWIKWLNGGNSEARGGTDWTLIGSNADLVVSADSATAMTGDHKKMSAEHRIRYYKQEGIGHNDYTDIGKGMTYDYWRIRNGGKGYRVSNSAGPIRMANRATQFARW